MIWNVLKSIWDQMAPGPKMKDYFDTCFDFIMKWEGGARYTNDPDDPGGETKYGISKRAFPHLDIKNLTEAEAKSIYRVKYWGAANADTKGWPLCLALFDTAVNCGVSRAKKWDAGTGDYKSRAIFLLNQREDYYNALVRKRPTMKKYLKGWMNRVNDLRKYCL